MDPRVLFAFIAFIVLVIAITFWLFLIFPSKYYAKKYPQWKSTGNHIAIIIVDNYFPSRQILDIHLSGIHFLIQKFYQKISYQVYNPVSMKEFKKIVKNPKTKILFIFGHGQIKKLRFARVGKRKFLNYINLKNFPRKEYLAQMHCNGGSGSSLKELISKHGSVIPKDLHFWDIRKELKRILNNDFCFTQSLKALKQEKIFKEL